MSIKILPKRKHFLSLKLWTFPRAINCGLKQEIMVGVVCYINVRPCNREKYTY